LRSVSCPSHARLARFSPAPNRLFASDKEKVLDSFCNSVVCKLTILNAIDKIFHLLDQFTDEKPQWGVRELSVQLGLSPTLTHWYLKNLERNRVVRKDPDTDKYELAHRLFELASKNSQLTVMKGIADPFLRHLSNVFKGTAVLKVLDGRELFCLSVVQSPSSLRVHYAEGSRASCNFGCLGKLLMAYIDENRAEQLVKKGFVHQFTSRTIVELPALKAEWSKIRMRGWAYSDGEAIEGARAVAAPLRDSSGNICAAIGLMFPAISLPKSRVESVAREVVKTATAISLQLGWKEVSKPARSKQSEAGEFVPGRRLERSK
jgi:DNA-binding IclR family transcriptional regulator